MISAEETINNYSKNLLIYKLLEYLFKYRFITEKKFNEISANGGFRTRFNGNGCGKLALMNQSNCWMEKFQNIHGPIIKKKEGIYLLTDTWLYILRKTDISV